MVTLVGACRLIFIFSVLTYLQCGGAAASCIAVLAFIAVSVSHILITLVGTCLLRAFFPILTNLQNIATAGQLVFGAFSAIRVFAIRHVTSHGTGRRRPRAVVLANLCITRHIYRFALLGSRGTFQTFVILAAKLAILLVCNGISAFGDQF